MAARSFKQCIEQKLGKFAYFVIYVIFEWMLIFLLFIDGLIAFAANEFARFFELRIPCLLCTRIDHVLVRRDPDFYYNDSICEAHRKDVSSLAYCHVHQKLSDIRRMCEGCLLSFATENKSDCDTYRSLVGILGKDLVCSVEDDHKIHLRLPASEWDSLQVEKSSNYQCSCCGELLRMRTPYPQGLIQSQFPPDGKDILQAPTPTPRAQIMVKNEESQSLDLLPHVRYTELKFTSDNESEIQDDDGSIISVPENQCREDAKAAAVPLLTEPEDVNEDTCKTPSFMKGNRLWGISLTDSTTASPKWLSRFAKRSPTEKPDLAREPLEGNTISEADGEAIVHLLKRQVRLDRKSLIALYMELDEERSASAVAANNAMAMITRLQAEKAAVQMEALQYQRMMEEQAEYDQEALQVLKDLLKKRDEEIKVLKAGGTYRERFEGTKGSGLERSKASADKIYRRLKSWSNSSFSGKSECGSPPPNPDELDNNGEREYYADQTTPSMEDNKFGLLNELIVDFEGERFNLLEQLRILKKKSPLASGDGDCSLQPKSDVVYLEDEDGGNGISNATGIKVSNLSERLKALDADKEFMKRATLGLQNGGEGTKLLKDIAQHLRELRQVEKKPLESRIL